MSIALLITCIPFIPFLTVGWILFCYKVADIVADNFPGPWELAAGAMTLSVIIPLPLAIIGICLFQTPNKPSLSYSNCFIDKDTNETTIIVPEE
jgi:hypothetical protein